MSGIGCIKFIKADPSTYLIHYKNGKIVKEGAGLSFFYYAPSSSLVCVPLGSDNIDFIFTELTEDFQSVTVQGQIACKIVNVRKLTSMLNFTVDKKGRYLSEDPEKLRQKLLNLVQVITRRELAALALREAMAAAESIASAIRTEAASSPLLAELGLEIIDASVLAVMPNKETARALEAETRETLLRQADEDVYRRRNAAIEQERLIKENELNTEAAVETKKREIMERRMEALKVEQEKKQEMDEAKTAGRIVLEKQNETLVAVRAENDKKLADAKAYGLDAILRPLRESDSRLIQALVTRGMEPAQLIAMSFKELAEQAGKIGQLNLSPDLLHQLLEKDDGKTHRQ
jgi:hypothetical protein